MKKLKRQLTHSTLKAKGKYNSKKLLMISVDVHSVHIAFCFCVKQNFISRRLFIAYTRKEGASSRKNTDRRKESGKAKGNIKKGERKWMKIKKVFFLVHLSLPRSFLLLPTHWHFKCCLFVDSSEVERLFDFC
jgi:hypothetical protein